MSDDQFDEPANRTGRTMTDGGRDGAAQLPIDADVIESVAKSENVPYEDLTDALSVFDASLAEMHPTYEDAYDYVTVEGVRGYVVTTETWDRLHDEHDIAARLAQAAQRAHTEQTRQLLSAASDDRATERENEDIDGGIVIGTAE
jgi:hypothetical protein